MSIDRKLNELGFVQIREDEYGAEYVKDCGDYTHKVAILHKASGKHILQSYDPNLADKKGVGCANVGLTYTELRLFTKKMRQLGLKS